MVVKHPHRLSAELRFVDARLQEWAKWCRDGMAQIGWPVETYLGRVIRLGALGAAQAGAPIHMPEHIELVDKAVAKLMNIERQVVCTYYLYWEPQEVRAKRCNMSVRRFGLLLERSRRRVGDLI